MKEIDVMAVMAKAAEQVRMEDHLNPERICDWCSHPRNSDECQFATKHTPDPTWVAISARYRDRMRDRGLG